MSLYEIEEKFCRSELAIIGWRSQETSYLMNRKMKKGQASVGPPDSAPGAYNNPSVPSGLPGKFFNSDGELDLRQVTGAEAAQFLRHQGVHVPFMANKKEAKDG